MGFLVDTNVISELRRKSANHHVLAWQNRYAVSELWISVLSLLEIRAGTEQVRASDPDFAGKLDSWYRDVLLKVYSGRILTVTLDICETRASLPVKRSLPIIDGLLGATAKRHDLTLATRNLKDFADLGIQLVNPWEHPLD